MLRGRTGRVKGFYTVDQGNFRPSHRSGRSSRPNLAHPFSGDPQRHANGFQRFTASPAFEDLVVTVISVAGPGGRLWKLARPSRGDVFAELLRQREQVAL